MFIDLYIYVLCSLICIFICSFTTADIFKTTEGEILRIFVVRAWMLCFILRDLAGLFCWAWSYGPSADHFSCSVCCKPECQHKNVHQSEDQVRIIAKAWSCISFVFMLSIHFKCLQKRTKDSWGRWGGGGASGEGVTGPASEGSRRVGSGMNGLLEKWIGCRPTLAMS